MHNTVQISGLEAGFVQQACNAGDNRFRWITRRRQSLAGRHQIARWIMQNEIREGAADINADTCCGTHGLAP